MKEKKFYRVLMTVELVKEVLIEARDEDEARRNVAALYDDGHIEIGADYAANSFADVEEEITKEEFDADPGYEQEDFGYGKFKS